MRYMKLMKSLMLIKYASGFLILLVSLALKMDDGIVLSQGIQDLAIVALTFENLCPVTRMMVQESE